MVARYTPRTPSTKSNGYFANEKPLQFIESGCTLLDLILGGGWALGRVSNIVGDKAVGKTLLAIEACANFARQYPQGKIYYREAESAFDISYARAVGLPAERVDFGPEGIETSWDTIEEIFKDLKKCLAICEKAGVPGLYIVDSLDALSSEADLEADVEKGFRLRKQSVLGELFKRLIRMVKRTSVSVIIINQVRANIGVTFGEKYRRSGGKALDFYASQVVWLSHLKNIVVTKGGVKRVIGVRVRAKCKKNKITSPFRECDFAIRFGYGVSSDEANEDFLSEAKVKIPARADAKELADLTKQVWLKQEEAFLPKERKYT